MPGAGASRRPPRDLPALRSGCWCLPAKRHGPHGSTRASAATPEQPIPSAGNGPAAATGPADPALPVPPGSRARPAGRRGYPPHPLSDRCPARERVGGRHETCRLCGPDAGASRQNGTAPTGRRGHPPQPLSGRCPARGRVGGRHGTCRLCGPDAGASRQNGTAPHGSTRAPAAPPEQPMPRRGGGPAAATRPAGSAVRMLVPPGRTARPPAGRRRHPPHPLSSRCPAPGTGRQPSRTYHPAGDAGP